jgi:hypothetical protein
MVLIEHMCSPRKVRAVGQALKPHAHDIARRLLRAAADSRRKEGDPVLVPVNLLSEVIMLLLALPGPQRGRPTNVETLQLQRLLAEGRTKRGAAREVSGKTGKPLENLRRRTRPKKPGKPKRKGGT